MMWEQIELFFAYELLTCLGLLYVFCLFGALVSMIGKQAAVVAGFAVKTYFEQKKVFFEALGKEIDEGSVEVSHGKKTSFNN